MFWRLRGTWMKLRLLYPLVLSLTLSAWADFDDGVAAYERGDYKTALQQLRPLAEQGLADAQHKLGWMLSLLKSRSLDLISNINEHNLGF